MKKERHPKGEIVSQNKIRKVPLLVLLLFTLVLAACGAEAGAGAAEGDSLEVAFSSPEDAAEVAGTFTAEFDSNVPLGDPSTGNHHVHLCVDSDDCSTETEYTLVYGNTFEVTGLAPGEHILGASLRNADHSDAGPGDEIRVTVAEGGGATDPATNTTDGPTDTTAGGGFDYDY